MPQKLPVKGFEWVEDISEFDESFIKKLHWRKLWKVLCWSGCSVSLKITRPSQLFTTFHERMKIEKVEELVANLHDEAKYFLYIRNLKQVLNHKLVLKKIHRVVKFLEKAWLKSYTDMNTKLKECKKRLWERISQLMNNSVFEKTTENVRKHRYLKFEQQGRE